MLDSSFANSKDYVWTSTNSGYEGDFSTAEELVQILKNVPSHKLKGFNFACVSLNAPNTGSAADMPTQDNLNQYHSFIYDGPNTIRAFRNYEIGNGFLLNKVGRTVLFAYLHILVVDIVVELQL